MFAMFRNCTAWSNTTGVLKLKINLSDGSTKCGKLKISAERLTFGLECDTSTILSGGRG